MLNHNLTNKILTQKHKLYELEKKERLIKDLDRMIDEICDDIGTTILKQVKDARLLMPQKMWMLMYNEVFQCGIKYDGVDYPKLYRLLFISSVKNGLLYTDEEVVRLRRIFRFLFRYYIPVNIGKIVDDEYFKDGIRYVNDDFEGYIKSVVDKIRKN